MPSAATNLDISAQSLTSFAKQIEDPKQQVIREHFQVLFRILKQDPKILEDSTWNGALQRLKKSPQPWKIVSGPLAAGIQYLRDLGWNVDKKDTWQPILVSSMLIRMTPGLSGNSGICSIGPFNRIVMTKDCVLR